MRTPATGPMRPDINGPLEESEDPSAWIAHHYSADEEEEVMVEDDDEGYDG